MVSQAEPNDLSCSLGEILLFGNKERLKIGSDIEEIYLDCRVKRLVDCLGPRTGWRHCFASMIVLLEDCVSDYHIFLENEFIKETEQKNASEMKDEECRSGAQIKKGKCKTFVEFLRDRFVSTATPLRYCISLICTHIAKNYISVDNFEHLISLIRLVDSFEILLSQGNIVSEALEELFSHSDVEDVSELFEDDSFDLCMMRRDCLLVLRTLQVSLGKLTFPNIRNEQSIREFCFQRASIIFCTASSSSKLHRVAMEPLSIVVIDEAAQLKECESTIPLQLPGVKHAVLVGDECQLPATVNSNVRCHYIHIFFPSLIIFFIVLLYCKLYLLSYLL
jgi:senataxin